MIQKAITKYGLALHLAMLAALPSALAPFVSDHALGRTVLWLSFLGALWIFIEPSIRQGEHLSQARVRVLNGIVRDPVVWFFALLVFFTGVRWLNSDIELVYDSEKVSYEKLLDIYFANVDPFDAEGQFIDKGFSYTLAIFYNNEEEKEISERKIADIEKNSGKETHVALLPYKNFYEAEEYHQDYYLKNPEAFEKELIESGRKQ